MSKLCKIYGTLCTVVGVILVITLLGFDAQLFWCAFILVPIQR